MFPLWKMAVKLRIECFWVSPVYLQSKIMFLFFSGHNGNQKVKSLSLSSWSLLLVTSTPKTSSLWSFGVMCTVDPASLGLSVTISSLLLWCFWHICFYALKIRPKQYPDPRFAFCCQWNTTGRTSGFLKSFSTASAFGKQLVLLKLRPFYLEWRIAIIARYSVIFCRSSQAWGKQVAELVPFSSQSPPEWSWTDPTFNCFLFCQI